MQGHVFRVGPNELSFASATSFKAIYGNRTAGEPKVTKDAFYDMFGSGFNEACLGSEKDPRKAGNKRGLFSAAFSAKALSEQEVIIQHCIDQFIEKLGILGSGPQGVDMVKWYEMVSFDILGEMAFGETFGCIEAESPHYWLDIILGHMLIITLMDNLRRYPLFLAAAKALPAKWTSSLRNKQTDFSREKVRQRLKKDADQRDFLTNVANKVRNGEVSAEEMAAHSSTIVGRFKRLEDIDITTTGQLPYLQAVIKEGLRIFPANSQGLPRRSPGMVVDGHFVPEGTEFYVSPWTVSHDERYFHDPMVFKPERWLDPNCTDVKEASQPFSLGPRGCIGKSFAYAQMSLELAKIVWKYDMELVNPDLDYEAECRMHFMWHKPKVNIRFSQRKI
ncbi:hypothetical protein SLS53_000418 [Cytospora paraplurivora]|uniref:Cytochrome P450 monooxygenase n=1 Tax=Cytospora paraplurivora TaxID=2898453 RepID=A0AAN9YPJ5_9PEZI